MFLISAALFTSGGAGVMNQVVWQRSLKRFVGGSETLSSMAVVLVFMAGLGIGSIWMGNRAARLKNPCHAFAFTELGLWGVNCLIMVLLSTDLSASLFSFQKAAVTSGVPLPLLYLLSSMLVLMLPCLLMGATLPLASETFQRQLKYTDSKILGWLFFINTFGSVAGSAVGAIYLIPRLGLTMSLVIASTLNLCAFLLLSVLSSRVPKIEETPSPNAIPEKPRLSMFSMRGFDLLVFGLGFCSLGYEVLLFRLFALVNMPLAYVFATVLTGFLLMWSLGAYVASIWRFGKTTTWLKVLALMIALQIGYFIIDVPQPAGSLSNFIFGLCARWVYFAPCFVFGYLYTQITTDCAESWGQDVARIYSWSTLGSCLGVLAMTFLGNEISPLSMLLVLALLLAAMDRYAANNAGAENVGSAAKGSTLVTAALALILLVGSFFKGIPLVRQDARWFFGKDGVIGVDAYGNMFWDGLWHSALSNNGNHIGTRNWMLGVCPVLLHPTGEIKECCVIGAGTGITAVTLARLNSVQHIDAYDLTHTLEPVYAAYPDGTLGFRTNPKIDLIWQDARTGMALREKKYDLIQAQPMYLKQSGSSLLNSLEFYKLVASRLNKNGVFCLYSNGTPEQALIVRNTASRVFAYFDTFMDGYLLVCSNDPLDRSVIAMERKFQRFFDDPLWREIRANQSTEDPERAAALIDYPKLPFLCGNLIVTDDYPIMEYPEILSSEVIKRLYPNGPPPPANPFNPVIH